MVKELQNKKEMKGFISIPLKKKVTPSGNSAHIVVSKDYLYCDADIKIKMKYIICQRCSETFTKKENFSPDPLYCNECYNAIKFLESKKGKLKCHKCKKPITEEEYKQAWNEEICQSCWIKDAEEFSKNNKQEDLEDE